jgi:ArsR family transcriptional regulator, arsenate/arsenite/antimonite-responsive transcriptional repressor
MTSQELATLFKALSEPVRVRLLALLLRRDALCVCDLMEAVGLSQSVVSRHLAYLRNHGLVSAERRGVWMYYSIPAQSRTALQPLWQLLQAEEADGDIAQDAARMAETGTCS